MDQLNAALVNIDFFQKYLKNLTDLQLLSDQQIANMRLSNVSYFFV